MLDKLRVAFLNSVEYSLDYGVFQFDDKEHSQKEEITFGSKPRQSLTRNYDISISMSTVSLVILRMLRRLYRMVRERENKESVTLKNITDAIISQRRQTRNCL